MKKIIVLLLLSVSLSAEGFYSAGAFSYDAVHADPFVQDGMYFTTSVLIGADWKFIYTETETVTDVTKSDKHMFSPYNTEYYARVGATYKKVYIEYEHLCIHGVDEYNPQGGHDRFTIGFDTRYE